MAEIPSQQAGSSRQEATHEANDRIASAAVSHHFDRAIGVPFMCECDRAACDEFVLLTLPEYEQRRRSGERLVAPGHGRRLGRLS